jgi:signal peptidase I
LGLSKNVRRALTYVLIILVIVAGAQLVVGSALGSSPVFVVVSKSMVPTLQIGDLVVIHSMPYSSIHVGQVIVFQEPSPYGTCPNPLGLTVVHRVVNVTSSGLITQGDDRVTNPRPDEPDSWPPIPSECVKGVVFLAIPYLGLVSMYIQYPWNYAIVVLILLFVFVSEFRSPGTKEEKSEDDGGGAAPSGGGQAPASEAPSPSPGASQQSSGIL